jgi:hypothetical protein
MASDVEGIEAAEEAIRALRTALAPWKTSVGARVRWRVFAGDFDGTPEILAPALHAAHEALASRHRAPQVLQHARKLAQEVDEAARARFGERPILARALAHAAYVDEVWRAASFDAHTNPVTPLRELWQTGYALSTLDDKGVTLETPALSV